MDLPLWFVANFGTAFLVCGYAMLRGGGPEKLVGMFLLGANILTFVIPDRRWNDVQFGVMALDIVAFVLFVVLAMVVDRWWTLFLAGFQGLCVLLHLAFWAQMKITSFVYSTGLNLIGYAVFATLLAGTVAYARRQRGPPMVAT
jgi:hypothetical protein